MKKRIAFDLDGTLTESKSPLDAEMSELLTSLLGVIKVAETKRVIEAIIACLSDRDHKVVDSSKVYDDTESGRV